jgi:hypothetical protein
VYENDFCPHIFYLYAEREIWKIYACYSITYARIRIAEEVLYRPTRPEFCGGGRCGEAR